MTRRHMTALEEQWRTDEEEGVTICQGDTIVFSDGSSDKQDVLGEIGEGDPPGWVYNMRRHCPPSKSLVQDFNTPFPPLVKSYTGREQGWDRGTPCPVPSLWHWW